MAACHVPLHILCTDMLPPPAPWETQDRQRMNPSSSSSEALGCQDPTLLWQSTADVRASVSIGRLILPTSSIHGTLARLGPDPPGWIDVPLLFRKTPSLNQSKLRTCGRRASLIDWPIRVVVRVFWGHSALADRYKHKRQRQAKWNEWIA